MNKRGGKRENSGRPKGEPSKRMRIPESLAEGVSHLISLHRQGIELDFDYCAQKSKFEYELSQQDLPDTFYKFVENFPEYEDEIEKSIPVLQLIEAWELVRKYPRQHRKILIKLLQKS